MVIASEKKVPSPLVDASTVEKTAMLTANVGITYSGMGPDFRVLVDKGRKAGQKYWLEYHDPIPVALLARELATVMQEFTQSGGVRPFGVSLLVAGFDDDGPQLYQVRTRHSHSHSLRPRPLECLADASQHSRTSCAGFIRNHTTMLCMNTLCLNEKKPRVRDTRLPLVPPHLLFSQPLASWLTCGVFPFPLSLSLSLL